MGTFESKMLDPQVPGPLRLLFLYLFYCLRFSYVDNLDHTFYISLLMNNEVVLTKLFFNK